MVNKLQDCESCSGLNHVYFIICLHLLISPIYRKTAEKAENWQQGQFDIPFKSFSSKKKKPAGLPFLTFRCSRKCSTFPKLKTGEIKYQKVIYFNLC